MIEILLLLMQKSGHFLETLDIIISTQLVVIVLVSFLNVYMLGSNKMNYNLENGWYYNNGYDKSPSWSGVEFLYKFLATNKSYGPHGITTTQENVIPGDIAQLSFSGTKFEHSLFIIDTSNGISIATHTYDVLGKKLVDYTFAKVRFVHIENVGV